MRKYTPDGDLLWTTQFGTSLFETAYGVAVNATGIYVSGETYGTFPGEPAGTGTDPYLARLDLDGGVDWVRQLGIRSPGQPPFTSPGGVAVDDSGVYLVANVIGRMPFRKYDFAGNTVWARDIPDVADCFFFSFAVSAYGGRVSLIGQVDKEFYEDMTVCREVGVVVGGLRTYTADGELLWQRAVEAGPVEGEEPFTGGKVVHASATGVYVAANTTTTFAGHRSTVPRPDYSVCAGLGNPFFDALDGYVRRYDNDGNVVWTHQFGSKVFDIVTGLVAGEDSVYAAGDTSCSLEGRPYAGGSRDGFLIRFAIEPHDPAGLTHLIVGKLEALDDARPLAPDVRDGLLEPLTRALRAIEKGHPYPARNQLEEFIRVVERYRDQSILTRLVAKDLSDAARAAIAEL